MTITRTVKKAPTQRTPQQQREARTFLKNHTITVRGKLTMTSDLNVNDFDDTANYFTFSLEEPQIWDVTTQTWLPLPDKFRVSSHSPELARAEFWQRWSIYATRKYGFRVSIENLNNQ
jgi:hypothetical protein